MSNKDVILKGISQMTVVTFHFVNQILSFFLKLFLLIRMDASPLKSMV